MKVKVIVKAGVGLRSRLNDPVRVLCPVACARMQSVGIVKLKALCGFARPAAESLRFIYNPDIEKLPSQYYV